MLLPLLRCEEDLVLPIFFGDLLRGMYGQKAKGKPLPDSVEKRYKCLAQPNTE